MQTVADERIFLDSNVLLYAFKGQRPLADECGKILAMPGIIFLSSIFLKLELLPIPRAFKLEKESQFLERFFRETQDVAIDLGDIVKKAEILAAKYGLGPMDALHISAAFLGNAKTFYTVEKPTKPLCRVTEVNVVSLYPTA